MFLREKWTNDCPCDGMGSHSLCCLVLGTGPAVDSLAFREGWRGMGQVNPKLKLRNWRTKSKRSGTVTRGLWDPVNVLFVQLVPAFPV